MVAFSIRVTKNSIPKSIKKEMQSAVKDLLDIADKDFDIITAHDENPAQFRISVSGTRGSIETSDEYFARRNNGTAPSIIRAKNKQALRFPVTSTPATTPNVIGSRPRTQSGAYVVVKSVNHPGIDARNHDKVTMGHVEQELIGVVCKRLEKAFSG